MCLKNEKACNLNGLENSVSREEHMDSFFIAISVHEMAVL